MRVSVCTRTELIIQWRHEQRHKIAGESDNGELIMITIEEVEYTLTGAQLNDLLHGAIRSFIAKCNSFSATGAPLIQVGAITEEAEFGAV